MIFTSSEVVYPKKETTEETTSIPIHGGFVLNIISDGRASLHPDIIHFEYNDKIYELKGARKLKNVCKYYKKNGGDFYFNCRLLIKNFQEDDETNIITGTITKVYPLHINR